MNNGKTRSTLLGVVGGYLLYTAYQLFEGRADVNTTMTMTARIIFIVLFALAGAALVVYACLLWKRALREEDEKNARETQKDDNSMK